MSDFTIKNIVYLFRLCKDSGVMPRGLLDERYFSTTSKILQKNRNIVMLILMINFIHSFAKKYYKHKVRGIRDGQFRHTPCSHRRNDYPIVFVHGYLGYSPDQCCVGAYFKHAFKVIDPHQSDDIYLTVTSPIACVHDRACELYQQLVGITEIKKRAGIEENDNGPALVRAIYGH